MNTSHNIVNNYSGCVDRQYYTITAPLTADCHRDESAYSKAKAECQVRRFSPDEDAVDGRLARKGQRWFFDYDDEDVADDEPVHRLGEHRFAVGEYVTVTDEGGRPLTYKVVEVQPAQ